MIFEPVFDINSFGNMQNVKGQTHNNRSALPQSLIWKKQATYTITAPQNFILEFQELLPDRRWGHWEGQEVGEGFPPAHGVHNDVNPGFGRDHAIPLWTSDNWVNKRPMGHITHLRKQYKSINTYDYMIS